MPVTFRRRDRLGKEAEERVGIAIRKGFAPLGNFLVNRLKQRAPVDTKKYQRSIKYRVSGRGLRTRMIVFANAQHAEFIEKGREPGKHPPPGNMLAWVKRRGLGASALSLKSRRAISAGTRRIFNRKSGKLRTAAQSLLQIQKSIAFLVGRKIARRGIKGHFFFRDLKQDYASQISGSLSRIRSLVAQHLNNA